MKRALCDRSIDREPKCACETSTARTVRREKVGISTSPAHRQLRFMYKMFTASCPTSGLERIPCTRTTATAVIQILSSKEK